MFETNIPKKLLLAVAKAVIDINKTLTAHNMEALSSGTVTEIRGMIRTMEG